MTKALEDIAAERRRQIEAEGWTPEHDDGHFNGSLARAAACYAIGSPTMRQNGHTLHIWPWDIGWWKSTDRRRDLVKAGALIVAEIERLDRADISNGIPNTEAPTSCMGTQLTDAGYAIREAHNLITWTWQAYIAVDQQPSRGWWHVKDMDPKVRDMMGAAEQGLYDALMKTPE